MNGNSDSASEAIGTWKDDVWYIWFLYVQLWRVGDHIAIALPLIPFGVFVFLGHPTSIYHFLSAAILVLSAGLWRLSVVEKHDVEVIAQFIEGWRKRFANSKFTLLPLDPALMAGAAHAFESDGDIPILLLTEPREGEKWPSAWMTYQFRGRQPVICVDTHPAVLTSCQRFLLNHEIGHCQFSHRLENAIISDLRWIVPAFMGCAYLLFPRAVMSEALFVSATMVIGVTAVSLARRSAKQEDPSEALSDDFAIAALVVESEGDRAKCNKVANIYAKTLASTAERDALRERVDWYVEWYAIQGGPKFLRMLSQINWTTRKNIGFLRSIALWSCLILSGVTAEVHSAWQIAGLAFVGIVIPMHLFGGNRIKFKARAEGCEMMTDRRGSFLTPDVEVKT
jgi:hypothetical protein